MNPWYILLAAFLYASSLFGIAYWAERRIQKGKRSLLGSPYIYTLSLGVYCSAWTYFGAVGTMVQEGVHFMAIYLGPALLAPAWWIVVRKMVRICQVERISTLADLLSARYGKHAKLGSLVALVCALGVTPYISLQLKALENSLALFGVYRQEYLLDPSVFIALGLAGFSILFGSQATERTGKHEGMVVAIAFESVVKLAALLLVALVVVFGYTKGLGNLLQQTSALPSLEKAWTLSGPTAYVKWISVCLLSACAVILLPRQFQMAVLENTQEEHIAKAMWLFPLYLFILSLLVVPIALAGALYLQGQVHPDTYVLALPLSRGDYLLGFIVYIGGFSAASSMAIVCMISVGKMLTHNVFMPLLLNIGRPPATRVRAYHQYLTWVSITMVMLAAYAYLRVVVGKVALVSIGLTSFAAVAQLLPATLGGLFWKGGTRRGAYYAIAAGFMVWGYTLVIPGMVSTGLFPSYWLSEGPWGMDWLRPLQLFGMEGSDPLAHGLFWSLLLNTSLYIGISLFDIAKAKERNQAELFVDIFRYGPVYEQSVAWKGVAYVPDLYTLLEQILGHRRARKALERYGERHGVDIMRLQAVAPPSFVTYVERLLAGQVGTVSASLLVSSSTKEEEIQFRDVLGILKESQQLIRLNQSLHKKSQELEQASRQLARALEQLRQLDAQKDEFLYTVTHELRTPLTSIRALSEILHDHHGEMETEALEQFLHTINRESERMSRLISSVLDLEKFESGKQTLYYEHTELRLLLTEAIQNVSQLAQDGGISLDLRIEEDCTYIEADRDRLMQVLVNLLSNAIKACEGIFSPQVLLYVCRMADKLAIEVRDNGKGIPEEDLPRIFDKFFQAGNQLRQKPKGTGLGLAISKKIVELHDGQLHAESLPGQGTTFHLTLPLQTQQAAIVHDENTDRR